MFVGITARNARSGASLTRGRGRMGSVGIMMVGLTACLTSVPTYGQEKREADSFRVSVLEAVDNVDHLRVPLFGSVTVETNVQVARADVIARGIADVQILSPKRILVTGQGYGLTNIVLTGADDRQHVLSVSVELDLTRLNEAIRKIDPLSSASASSVLGNIILNGTASGPERATRIVELANLFLPPQAADGQPALVQNHLEVAGEPQVLLRCVVAEVSRSVSRELGINGFLAGDNFRDAFVVNQIGRVNAIDIGAPSDVPVNTTIPFVTGSDGIPIGTATTLSLGFPRIQLQAFLKAMADNSLLKILAEPNLVAISGQTATFLAGGEFPYPVPQGFQTLSIQFREFGVRLNFTPTVRGHQRIRLRVAPEVSELDFTTAIQLEGFVVPGLTTRSTQTTVEMGSGETLAIAGLLNDQVRSLSTRVPGIGDVPVLGALFRSVNFQHSKSELVILVTPEIISPLDEHQVGPLPTDGGRDPTDFELYGLGLVETRERQADQGNPKGLQRPGPAGDRPQSGLPQRSQPNELSVHGPWGHVNPPEDDERQPHSGLPQR